MFVKFTTYTGNAESFLDMPGAIIGTTGGIGGTVCDICAEGYESFEYMEKIIKDHRLGGVVTIYSDNIISHNYINGSIYTMETSTLIKTVEDINLHIGALTLDEYAKLTLSPEEYQVLVNSGESFSF